MMFKTLTALTLVGLAAAAPAPVAEKRQSLNAVVDGQVVAAYCGADGSSTYPERDLPSNIELFCNWANGVGGSYDTSQPTMDLGSGYHFHIVNQQDGDTLPCQKALTWVYENCAKNGKVGQYVTNANYYIFNN